MNRSIFNFYLCSMLAVAGLIYFATVTNVDVSFLATTSTAIIVIASLVAVVAASFALSSIDRIPLQLLGFVSLPVIFGVITAPFVRSLPTQVISDAATLTLLCVGITMLAATLFPNFFKRIIGVLIGTLVVVILATLVSVFVFNVELGFLNYVSVVLFMGFLGYELVISREVPPTFSYALAISGSMFVDIVQIFLNIASIVMDD